MGTCEMCGESGDVKKTRVEGTSLKLCEDCQEVGKVVEQPETTTRKKTRTRKQSTPSLPQEDEVVPDFNERVKAAREAKDLSVTELAKSMKEKESVVRRIEAGKLVPDKQLTRKLEKHLGVDLYQEETEIVEPQHTAPVEEDQTLGDVAEVRTKDE